MGLYDLIVNIIGYDFGTQYSSTILYACIMIIMFVLAIITDLIYRFFRGLWR